MCHVPPCCGSIQEAHHLNSKFSKYVIIGKTFAVGENLQKGESLSLEIFIYYIW